MIEQARQFNQSIDSVSPVNASLRLFIFPMLCADGTLCLIVLPYIFHHEGHEELEGKDTSKPLHVLHGRNTPSSGVTSASTIILGYDELGNHITDSRDTDPDTKGMPDYSGMSRLRARDFEHKAMSGCNSLAISDAYQHSDRDLWTQSDSTRMMRDALLYDSRDQLRKRGKLNYSYDANGSLISITHDDNGPQRSFVYNFDNRLIEVKDGQGQNISIYQYDPFGRRISKTVASTSLSTSAVTTYYFNAAEGMVAEMSASGQIKSQYGYRPDGSWGTNPLFIKQAGYTGYYQNDHLGTPQQIVSSSGQVLWQAHYSAFGLAEVTINTVTNNLRLAGQYFDQETNLHYNYFRYYDLSIGRFISSDPIGLAGGINTYGYVGGNPLYWVDPMGLLPKVTPPFKPRVPHYVQPKRGESPNFWKYRQNFFRNVERAQWKSYIEQPSYPISRGPDIPGLIGKFIKNNFDLPISAPPFVPMMCPTPTNTERNFNECVKANQCT